MRNLVIQNVPGPAMRIRQKSMLAPLMNYLRSPFTGENSKGGINGDGRPKNSGVPVARNLFHQQ